MKTVLLLVLGSILLTSCGNSTSRWSEAEKSSLSSLAVLPASFVTDAYDSPVGSRMHAPTPQILPAQGGFAGALGAGVGSLLIVEIGSAIQQQAFESRYSEAIARASQTVPRDLPTRIRKAVSEDLGTLPHFRNRIRENSPNRFTITVERFRYVHAGKSGDETLVTPSLSGRFKIVGADGRQLLDTPFEAPATTISKPITAFASDPMLSSRAFDEAVANLALQAAMSVGDKLGETAGSVIKAGIPVDPR
jgi:hypothetical protein